MELDIVKDAGLFKKGKLRIIKNVSGIIKILHLFLEHVDALIGALHGAIIAKEFQINT